MDQGMPLDEAYAEYKRQEDARVRKETENLDRGLTDEDIHRLWGDLKNKKELVERRSNKVRRLTDTLQRANEELDEAAAKYAEIKLKLET